MELKQQEEMENKEKQEGVKLKMGTEMKNIKWYVHEVEVSVLGSI